MLRHRQRREAVASFELSDGYTGLGTDGVRTLEDIVRFSVNGIASIQFKQNTADGQFQVNGNGMSGRLVIVGTNGNTVLIGSADNNPDDQPVIAEWKKKAGSTLLGIGLFISTPLKPAVGTKLEVLIRIGDGKQIELPAEVASSCILGPGSETGIGCKFGRLDETQQAIVDEMFATAIDGVQ